MLFAAFVLSACAGVDDATLRESGTGETVAGDRNQVIGTVPGRSARGAVAGGGSGATAGTVSGDALRLLASASAALKRRDFDDVISLTTRVIGAGGGSARALSYAHTLRAAANYSMRRYPAAVSDLGAAIAHDPQNYVALEGRGIILGRARRYDEALSDLNRSITLRPRFSSFYARGLLYLRMHDAQAAEGDLTRAVTLRPEHANAHFARGLSFHVRGRKAEAVAEYQRTLALEPGHRGAREALARIDRPAPRGPNLPTGPMTPPMVRT